MTVSIHFTSFEENADDILRIRHLVFVEEQGVDPALESDNQDASAQFIIAVHPEAGAIGTARLFTNGKISRFAVLKEWRSQGIGQAILKSILQYAHSQGIASLHLSSQVSAIPFYEKNGFSCVSEPYYEAGILHRKMALTILP